MHCSLKSTLFDSCPSNMIFRLRNTAKPTQGHWKTIRNSFSANKTLRKSLGPFGLRGNDCFRTVWRSRFVSAPFVPAGLLVGHCFSFICYGERCCRRRISGVDYAVIAVRRVCRNQPEGALITPRLTQKFTSPNSIIKSSQTVDLPN